MSFEFSWIYSLFPFPTLTVNKSAKAIARVESDSTTAVASSVQCSTFHLGFFIFKASFPLGFIKLILVFRLGFIGKYNNPRSQHDLYYWENTAEGTRSEVDYIIARDMKVLPIECKAGTSGKMKSLRVFMRQKHLTDAIRCSLENFSLLEHQEKTMVSTNRQDENALRRISINPLYAISTLYNSVNPSISIALV